MDQLSVALNFELLGTQKVANREAYLFKATPRSGYVPPNSEAEVLTGMQGMLWVDKKTFQWIKVEAEVKHPVAIDGFLARVEPGTRFELEKAPITDDVWLPKHFSMRSQAKILFFFSHHEEEDETYFGYQMAHDPQIPSVNSAVTARYIRG